MDKSKAKDIGRYVLGALAGAGLAWGVLSHFQNKGPQVEVTDLTRDGIEDVYVFQGLNEDGAIKDFAMIGMSDGSFEKAEISVYDGMPVYTTRFGTCTPAFGCAYTNPGQMAAHLGGSD